MKGHTWHARSWAALLAIVVLVVAHTALFSSALGGHWLVALVAGLLGVLGVKYAWWRYRR